MPVSKKFSAIFALVEKCTDEDSSVNLMMGNEISKQGSVFTRPKTAVDKDPEARLAAWISEPYSSAREIRGATATTSDTAACITKRTRKRLWSGEL